jgi:glycosyltransferase involved in cell wall biosynthesis
MNNSPLISVVMPVFNTEKYVAQAITSVLNQTYRPIEIICINDGSTDATKRVLESFGDSIIFVDSKENGGIGMARNKGIHMVKGEYLAFMDADDIWKPEKLALQINQLYKNPRLDMVFTYSQFFLSPDIAQATKDMRHLPDNAIPGYIAPTVLVKKSSFDKVGLFQTHWKVGEFIAWLTKAKDMGLQYMVMPDILHLRRIHQTNTVVTQRSQRSDYVKIVKEMLERKRLKQ